MIKVNYSFHVMYVFSVCRSLWLSTASFCFQQYWILFVFVVLVHRSICSNLSIRLLTALLYVYCLQCTMRGLSSQSLPSSTHYVTEIPTLIIEFNLSHALSMIILADLIYFIFYNINFFCFVMF